MKRISLVLLAAIAVAMPAFARDTVLHLDVNTVTDPGFSQGKLDGSVKFYFAGQKTPAVLSNLGAATTNRKTSGAGKSDNDACRWVMLTALVALQDDAKAHGANAVIGITSNYKNVTWASPTQYECHAGNIMAGVALKGTYAKIGKH